MEIQSIRTWQVSISSGVFVNGGWNHIDGSPFISDFTGTKDATRQHIPSLGSPFAGGTVMAFKVIPKEQDQ